MKTFIVKWTGEKFLVNLKSKSGTRTIAHHKQPLDINWLAKIVMPLVLDNDDVLECFASAIDPYMDALAFGPDDECTFTADELVGSVASQLIAMGGA